MINEQRTGNDVEGSGRGPFYPPRCLRGWTDEKHENLQYR
jgi:hypothetical protein